MPIQFPDFQRLSFNDANPFLVGAQTGQDMMQKYLMFPQDLQSKMLANQISQVQAQYAQPMAEQDLQKAKLYNQYYGPDIQSQIGLRGAQAGLAGAQTGLANVDMQNNLLKLNYLKQMLGGSGSPMGAPPQATDTQSGSPSIPPVSQASTSQGSYAPTSNATQSNQPQALPAQQQQQQPQAQSTLNNKIYGIDTPTPTRDDIANKMLLGIDTFTPRLQNAKTQQQDQYGQYQKEMAQTIQDANSAQKFKQLLYVFNNAMDNTGMKGAFWGDTPSTGWRTIYHPEQSVSQAQIADKMAANVLPSAIAELRDAMGTAKFSNLDMNLSGNMKFGRTMDDDTRRTQTQWFNGVSDRMDERAKFYSMMGNPKIGAQKVASDMLWEQYQRDFPLISKDGKTFQGSNLGNWPLYTTPRAIASMQETGTYSPSVAEKNTFMMKYPDGKVLPVKKGGVESAFRKGARPL